MAKHAAKEQKKYGLRSGQKARQSIKPFESRQMIEMAQRAEERDGSVTRKTIRALSTHFHCTIAVTFRVLEDASLNISDDQTPTKAKAAQNAPCRAGEAKPKGTSPTRSATEASEADKRATLGLGLQEKAETTTLSERQQLNSDKLDLQRRIREVTARENAVLERERVVEADIEEIEDLDAKLDEVWGLESTLRKTERLLQKERYLRALESENRIRRDAAGLPVRLITVEHAKEIAAKMVAEAEFGMRDLHDEIAALRRLNAKLKDQVDRHDRATPLDPMAVYGNGRAEFYEYEDAQYEH